MIANQSLFVEDEVLKQTRRAVRVFDLLVGDLNFFFTVLTYHSRGGVFGMMVILRRRKKKRCNRGRDTVGNLSALSALGGRSFFGLCVVLGRGGVHVYICLHVGNKERVTLTKMVKIALLIV